MWKLVLSVALLCCGSEAAGISCKDEGGKDVDWYILYKLPRKTSAGKGTGFECVYIVSAGDSNPNPNPKLNLCTKLINHQDGFLAKTLAPYFSPTPGNIDIGYIAYNDQPPEKSSVKSGSGHSKGFVMMDETSGIWLLHSTPKFPYTRESNSFFPDTGKSYGQTFICVTFDYDKFEYIGEHLQYIKAPIFDHHIPAGFHQSLHDAANGVRQDPNNLQLFKPLKSKHNNNFKCFVSKTSDDVKDGDLYVTIADTIHSDVQAQTWGRQAGRSDPYKTPGGNDVTNVECISIDNNREWKPAHDHSKWCVSNSGDWTCIADSNRAVSQFERPGGALCIEHKGVTDIFKRFIKKNKDDCSNGPTPPKRSKP